MLQARQCACNVFPAFGRHSSPVDGCDARRVNTSRAQGSCLVKGTAGWGLGRHGARLCSDDEGGGAHGDGLRGRLCGASARVGRGCHRVTRVRLTAPVTAHQPVAVTRPEGTHARAAASMRREHHSTRRAATSHVRSIKRLTLFSTCLALPPHPIPRTAVAPVTTPRTRNTPCASPASSRGQCPPRASCWSRSQRRP